MSTATPFNIIETSTVSSFICPYLCLDPRLICAPIKLSENSNIARRQSSTVMPPNHGFVLDGLVLDYAVLVWEHVPYSSGTDGKAAPKSHTLMTVEAVDVQEIHAKSCVRTTMTDCR